MENKDYLNGDHSAKMWFKVMWKNGLIFAFSLALLFYFFILKDFGDVKDLFRDAQLIEPGWLKWLVISGYIFFFNIPTLIIILVTKKGFIDYWNYLKGGKKK